MKGLFIKVLLVLCMTGSVFSFHSKESVQAASFSEWSAFEPYQLPEENRLVPGSLLTGELYKAAGASFYYQNRAGYAAADYVQALKNMIVGNVDKSGVIVAFGDSNTQGANWQENGYESKEKWVNMLGKNYNIINAGIGGNTTDHGIVRFEKDVLSKNPDVVTIMFGTNDAALTASGEPQVSKAKFEERLRYFTEMLQARGIGVILMTAIPVIESYYYVRNDWSLYSAHGGARQWHNSYNEIVRKVAKERKAVLIDVYQAITGPMPNVTDQQLIKSGFIDPSGTHFTPKGAAFIYHRVNMAITAMMMKKAAES